MGTRIFGHDDGPGRSLLQMDDAQAGLGEVDGLYRRFDGDRTLC